MKILSELHLIIENKKIIIEIILKFEKIKIIINFFSLNTKLHGINAITNSIQAFRLSIFNRMLE